MELEFNAVRWAVYLTLGPLALAAFFLIRSRYHKFLLLLAALIFLEGVFLSWRPFFFVGFSLSSALAYVFLVSIFISGESRGRMLALTPAWLVLLVFAGSGAVIGSFGPRTDFGSNIILFQFYYLEGLLYFWIGRMAFRGSLDTHRALVWLVRMGGLVAVLHLVTLATGYRFYTGADRLADAAEHVAFRYGAVFINPNTLADFYAMVFPVGVVLSLGWIRPTRFARVTISLSIVLMGVSLLLTASRGGLAATVLTCGVGLLLVPLGIRRVAGLVGGGVIAGSLTLSVLLLLFPEFLELALDRFTNIGVESARYEMWANTLKIIASHPLGLGLHTTGFQDAIRRYGIDLASPHNIYLGLAVDLGIPGLIAFLVIVAGCLRRVFRARRFGDATLRTVAAASLVLLLGFLLSGITEPIYRNGFKLQHVFWLFAGVGSFLPNWIPARVRTEQSETRSPFLGAAPGSGTQTLRPERIGSR